MVLHSRKALRSIVVGVSFVVLTVTGAFAAGSSENSQSSSNSGSSASASLEIFSWWTAGGESQALNALITGFEKNNPNIQIVNGAVAGGGGSNAKAVLANRMRAGNPPSTFQVHGGAEIAQWVAAGMLEPLDSLYKQYNLQFPQKVVDMESVNGQIYGVPIDIEKMNNIWYNKALFAQYGLTPPKTFADFFAVADKLKSVGVTPLALGDREVWEAVDIFDNCLFAELGPQQYSELWKGNVSFDSPQVRIAAQNFGKMLDYINDNHSSLTWNDAVQMVIDGKAAMNVMGDWAVGYFLSKNWQPDQQFGWTPFPGSSGYFLIDNDSFCLPKGVKDPEAVNAFLGYMGSAEAQVDFNELKGSIPASTDADMTNFNAYAKSAMSDYKAASSNDLLGLSMAHGIAASAGFVTKATEAVNIFVTQRNVDDLIQSLQQARSLLTR